MAGMSRTEKMIALVEEVEERQCLYNMYIDDFRNPTMKEEAWVEIAEALQMSIENCVNVWRLLSTRYGKEKRISEFYDIRSRWWLYKHLKFLDPFIPRKSQNAGDVASCWYGQSGQGAGRRKRRRPNIPQTTGPQSTHSNVKRTDPSSNDTISTRTVKKSKAKECKVIVIKQSDLNKPANYPKPVSNSTEASPNIQQVLVLKQPSSHQGQDVYYDVLDVTRSQYVRSGDNMCDEVVVSGASVQKDPLCEVLTAMNSEQFWQKVAANMKMMSDEDQMELQLIVSKLLVMAPHERTEVYNAHLARR